MKIRAGILLTGAAMLLSACSANPRAPDSFCMQRAVDGLALDGLPDGRRHCLAAGTIAGRCGAGPAFIAGYAKETADAFGPGDASSRDIAANKAGRDCARQLGGVNAGQDELAACCMQAGY